MIAGFGTGPRVGDILVAAGVDFVEEEVDFGGLELAAGDSAHVVDDVAGHGINLIKALKISGSKPAGALIADIDAMLAGDFQGQGVGGFTNVVAVGTGAFHDPIEACGTGFFLKDAFGEGAPADIAKANH